MEEAAASGSLPIVDSLIRRGADPNYRDRDGWSAIPWAAEEGHQEIISFWLGIWQFAAILSVLACFLAFRTLYLPDHDLTPALANYKACVINLATDCLLGSWTLQYLGICLWTCYSNHWWILAIGLVLLFLLLVA